MAERDVPPDRRGVGGRTPSAGGDVTGEGIHTFSVVGRCEATGQLGVAVATADVAAGRLVTWARAGAGAVATQSWPNLYLGIDALTMLAEGENAEDVLRSILEPDPGRAVRQLGIVDAAGHSAAFSGEDCTPWAGHVTGPGYAVQGNMLVGEETVTAMAQCFVESAPHPLVERLLAVLEAGQAAGGDRRGRQCASLLVVDKEEFPLWDLRVDDHRDPVAELRRIYQIADLDLLPFVQGLPTRGNPLGSLSEEFVEMDLRPPPERPGGGGSGPEPHADSH